MDTSFCDGHRLLFHNFMNGNSINVTHLVKLVDTDHSSITENHSACLKPPFTCFFIGCNSCGQTDAG